MLEGGCHCRAVRYRIDGEVLRHGLCHCTDCRGSAGAPVVSWIVLAEEQLEVTGDMITYASSEHGRRDFCPRCGTSLFYRNAAAMPGLVDVASATLDAPDLAAPPIEQINVVDRIGWMKSAHQLPEFEHFPPDL